MRQTTEQLNASYEKNFHPMRLEYSRNGEVDRIRTVLAGEVGESALTADMRQVVFTQIEARCGFSASSLKGSPGGHAPAFALA